MKISELREIGKRATERPWKWWTSCSWRRLMGASGTGKERHVLEPTVNRYDKHPDIIVTDADMALTEVAVNHWDALLDVAEAAQKYSAIIHKRDHPNHQCCADICTTLRHLEALK